MPTPRRTPPAPAPSRRGDPMWSPAGRPPDSFLANEPGRERCLLQFPPLAADTYIQVMMRLRKTLGAVLTAALLAAALLVLRSSERASADLDPTGTWHIDVAGDATASCSANFTLAGTAVSADWTCGTFGTGTLHGPLTKNADGTVFNIRGQIQQAAFVVYFYADGTVAPDGNSMSGTWYGEFDILTGSGTFSGQRQAAPTPDTPAPTDMPGGPTPTHTPSPAASPTPAGLPGDANCDHTVNSIDAAVTLQYTAALIHSLPCQGGADVNGDGMVNAIDVTLILQYVAGLLSHLPV
jgi:hypothetical protein